MFAKLKRYLLPAVVCLVTISHKALAQKGPINAGLFNLTQSAYNPAIYHLDQVLKYSSASQIHIADSNSQRLTSSNNFSTTIWYKNGFSWDSTDNNSSDWNLEGITTSSDAGSGSSDDADTDIIVSWVGTQGVRVSFISRGDTRAYTHALLVEPYTDSDGKPNYKSLGSINAGGIVWRGGFLFMADEDLGFRLFDLGHIYEVSSDRSSVGRDDTTGTYYGGGLGYVIPQARTYTALWTKLKNVSFRPHSLSLDRNSTVPSIVATEIRPETNDKADPVYDTKMARFQLDNDTNLLQTQGNTATAFWAYNTNVKNIGGMTFVPGRTIRTNFIVTNGGVVEPGMKSDIYVWAPGAYASYSYVKRLPANARNVAYRTDRNELWFVGGLSGERYLLALDVEGPQSGSAPRNTTGTSSGSTSSPTAGGTSSPSSTPIETKKLSGGAVAGISIGAALIFLASLVAFLLYRRKTKRRRQSLDYPTKPELDSSGSSRANKAFEGTDGLYSDERAFPPAFPEAKQYQSGYHENAAVLSPVSPSQEIDSYPKAFIPPTTELYDARQIRAPPPAAVELYGDTQPLARA